jgi:hypothetical protein
LRWHAGDWSLKSQAKERDNQGFAVFNAKGSPEFHTANWQPLALGGLTVIEIPTGHTAMVWPPFSDLLAEYFDACFKPSNR